MVVDTVLLQIVACSLSILMLAAGTQKLAYRQQFAGALAAYELAPACSMPLFLWLIPLLELSVGAGLLFAPDRPAFIAVAVLLFGVYALAMVINLWRGRHDIDCGCQLGSAPQQISYALVVRNLLLILAAGVLLLPAGERALHGFDYGVICFGVAMACLLYGAGNNLVATHKRLLAL